MVEPQLPDIYGDQTREIVYCNGRTRSNDIAADTAVSLLDFLGGIMAQSANGRTIYDADSHVMEAGDWLIPYADPSIRERLAPLSSEEDLRTADTALANSRARASDADTWTEGEQTVFTKKGWDAFGAMDPVERSRALDLLGFDLQLVLSTYAGQAFKNGDDELLYGGTRAYNRAIAEFCSSDSRLLPVGYVSLDDPDLAIRELDELIRLGCDAVLIPAKAPRGRAPSHPDFFPFWARLQDADMPFTLHVGGGGELFNPDYRANGLPVPTRGGDENLTSKDFMALHFAPEMFLSTIVLDGILDRFPKLRGACLEQGAGWVIPWLQQLDLAKEFFGRGDRNLGALTLRPSEYVRRQLTFTPMFPEPIGSLIEQGGAELFLFSSDFPHTEGGRDPIASFEENMLDTSEIAKDAFYRGNFARLMGSRLPISKPAEALT